MNKDRNKKIELLKRKSRRNGLTKEVSNYLTLSKESYMEIEDNDLFCKKVFRKLEEFHNKVVFDGHDYNEHINKSIEFLKNIYLSNEMKNKNARLFFYREEEIEAICLGINEIFTYLKELLVSIQFTNGRGDFILVADDLTFGICIERTEYYYELSMWGII